MVFVKANYQESFSFMIPQNISDQLAKWNQSHLLQFADQLDQNAIEQLVSQIALLNFSQIEKLLHDKKSGASNEESPRELAKRAKALSQVIRQNELSANPALVAELIAIGQQAMHDGKVAAILVAGGQGTRLGFPHPKGLFPIGPVSGNSMFQILFEQVLARSRQAKHAIPYYIMTSDATHSETLNFLDQYHYFGLPQKDVKLFRQGTMPAVDTETGKVLLADKAEIALSPDGHGGILQALTNNHCLQDMRERGIEYLYYHQVDNPTSIVCEPLLIGAHIKRQSEMTTKVAAKRSWDEKMGILAEVDGKTQIIEYSDLPDDIAQQTESNGQLKFWAGNMAIHVFSLSFLERITTGTSQIPFHIAHKKVPYINSKGDLINPASPNAYKFERFIFDALLFADHALVVEADRQREFNPVKNATGNDSPETSKQAILNIHKQWLTQAGIHLSPGINIEFSPLFALDAQQVLENRDSLTNITTSKFITH
jgi:UDP-N-acetylglucosamine/UDP-N-acetylgalactosamine diphosphorylase